jgi:hypothetical protein
MIDVEVPAIQPKPHIPDWQWVFGGYLKPIQIDKENVSVDFLNMLDKQGAIISNKSGSVNLSEINDVIFSRYLTDGISKYDQVTKKIVECLLKDGTEMEFPDYSYFKGIYLFPVEFIENEIYRLIKFTGFFKMDNLKKVESYDFVNSNFTGDFKCQNLQAVGERAFRLSVFNGIFSCENVSTVGIRAFEKSKFTGDFKCPNLLTVGEMAFQLSVFNGDFNCLNLTTVGNYALEFSIFNGTFNCPNLTTVGNYAFRNSVFNGVFECPNLTSIGDYAFRNSVFTGNCDLPACTSIGQYAFRNSNFDTITIGANATLGSNCIGAHSTEFIADYAANNKKAGTYVWNGQHWIYQT